MHGKEEHSQLEKGVTNYFNYWMQPQDVKENEEDAPQGSDLYVR
jgi:hypothetical protein